MKREFTGSDPDALANTPGKRVALVILLIFAAVALSCGIHEAVQGPQPPASCGDPAYTGTC